MTMLSLSVFRDERDETFIDLDAENIRETYRLNSPEFPHRLQRHILIRTGKLESIRELRKKIQIFDAAAHGRDVPVRRAWYRVACDAGNIQIDLGDAAGRVVEIDASGYRIVAESAVRFVRSPDAAPLPEPRAGGTLEMLHALLNLPNQDDFTLFVHWLLNAFRNVGGQPILVIQGPEGTAKSTLLEIVVGLLDPSHASINGLPLSEKSLAVLAACNYLLAFDNVRSITPRMSDALCRLSTQASAHPIVINGIGQIELAPDLADRCIVINCTQIGESRRRPGSEIFAAFGQCRAEILGALFSALVCGLHRLPDVNPVRLPRMADFALWAEACESAVGGPGSFEVAYEKNRRLIAENMVLADPLGAAVRDLVENSGVWSGTATDLHSALSPYLPGGKGPGTARDLAVRLRKIEAKLRKVDIGLEFSRVGNGRDRIITIRSTAPTPTTVIHRSVGAASESDAAGADSADRADSADGADSADSADRKGGKDSAGAEEAHHADGATVGEQHANAKAAARANAAGQRFLVRQRLRLRRRRRRIIAASTRSKPFSS